jgi:IS605 OrfB family transposase
MLLTYKFRIKDLSNTELNRQSKAVNFVWNFCNDRQKDALRWNKKWLSGYDLQKLTAGSSKELDIHAHTIQGICHQYEQSRKQHKKAYLRYRGKKSLGWIPFNQGHVTFKNGSFWFRGREFKAWVSRELHDGQKFQSGSFNQDAKGNWFINLPIEVKNLESAPSNAVGIDLGLKELATLSNGSTVEAKQFYRKSEEKLAVAQRAKKKKQVKNIHTKIKNQRKDFIHKATTAIASANSLIVVGDVNSRNLAKTNMAKSVLDAGWYDFKQKLRYKSIRNGGQYVEVSERWTTQTCSECGVIAQEAPKGMSGLGIRAWICGCGASHNRDVNSAKNILRIGLDTLAEGAKA